MYHQRSKHLKVPKELQHTVASLSVVLGGIILAKMMCVSVKEFVCGASQVKPREALGCEELG